ncbi:MAG TPA: spermine synthase [Anaerolineae bacterium]|nr:spermine synthase [Anaerolineae bacterium]
MIVLSRSQADKLLNARETGMGTISVTPDLGLTKCEVNVGEDGVRFPDVQWLGWDEVMRIRSSDVGCFMLEEGKLRKIQTFSEHTNRHISLMPTDGAPTLLVAGFPMHRIKGTDPSQDTLTKIETISPVIGRVLDTATGLGYTAIEASKTAEVVITIEIDPVVLEIAHLNPWSKDLFENPKIEQLIGDSFEVIQGFEDGSFSLIIHDPPTFSLAGELYSQAFYHQLYRVLERGSRLFHYIGDLESRSGKRVARGVVERLREVGFNCIRRHPEAFGVVGVR